MKMSLVMTKSSHDINLLINKISRFDNCFYNKINFSSNYISSRKMDYRQVHSHSHSIGSISFPPPPPLISSSNLQQYQHRMLNQGKTPHYYSHSNDANTSVIYSPYISRPYSSYPTNKPIVNIGTPTNGPISTSPINIQNQINNNNIEKNRNLMNNSSSFQQPQSQQQPKKKTLQTLAKMYKNGVKIAMITAYDYPSALAADISDIDMVLVGDSLAMVALGHDNTTEITLDEMIHHCKAVARGCKRGFIVGDLPFGSYSNKTQAVESSIRMIKEGRVEAIKIEGCNPEIVKEITSQGIPVVGHLGLTPQTATALGGYKVQGRTIQKSVQILKDALALEEAGCFCIVLEAIPPEVAELLTKYLTIPTIGIGAGPNCSGQVLVQLDALGFNDSPPKFCKQYAYLMHESIRGLSNYVSEVKNHQFPTLGLHTYVLDKSVSQDLSKLSTSFEEVVRERDNKHGNNKYN